MRHSTRRGYASRNSHRLTVELLEARQVLNTAGSIVCPLPDAPSPVQGPDLIDEPDDAPGVQAPVPGAGVGNLPGGPAVGPNIPPGPGTPVNPPLPPGGGLPGQAPGGVPGSPPGSFPGQFPGTDDDDVALANAVPLAIALNQVAPPDFRFTNLSPPNPGLLEFADPQFRDADLEPTGRPDLLTSPLAVPPGIVPSAQISRPSIQPFLLEIFGYPDEGPELVPRSRLVGGRLAQGEGEGDGILAGLIEERARNQAASEQERPLPAVEARPPEEPARWIGPEAITPDSQPFVPPMPDDSSDDFIPGYLQTPDPFAPLPPGPDDGSDNDSARGEASPLPAVVMAALAWEMTRKAVRTGRAGSVVPTRQVP